MTASFQLLLDTQTQIAAAINGGKPTTTSNIITLELALDPDAIEVKIWGDINPLDPGNAGMGETEAGAEWLTAKASFLVALTTSPALKELHVRVRDDVWNEATADASIRLGEEAPLPMPPRQRPLPASGLPQPSPRPEHRQLVSLIRAGRVRDHASLECRLNSNRVRVEAVPARAGIAVAHDITPIQLQTCVETFTRGSIPGIQPVYTMPPPDSAAATVRRDGPNLIAILEALDII